MIWRKPADMPHYTSMCKFIDENVTKIAQAGKYPDLEDKIWNYLWLIVKAIAIKKSMFQNFEDYDAFAFYAANRLFFALRKNQLNQGKTIKGKVIRPIKSCLNYMKAILHPMLLDFRAETFNEIIDEEFASKKFDALALKDDMIESVKADQMNKELFSTYLNDTLHAIGKLLDNILEELPFSNTSLEYNRIKISILLNCLNNLKVKRKINVDNNAIPIVWKLPKSMSRYIKILIRKFTIKFANEITDCYNSATLNDETVESILTYREGSNYDNEESD